MIGRGTNGDSQRYPEANELSVHGRQYSGSESRRRASAILLGVIRDGGNLA